MLSAKDTATDVAELVWFAQLVVARGGGDTGLVASAKVELVRSIYTAWGRGDDSSTDWADPEIECVIADGPSPGTWTRLAGMAEGWRWFLFFRMDVRAEER